MAGICALAIGVAAISSGLRAQDAVEMDDPFNIPENITMLGENNPNLRRATAVVNGQVITGTDVDQRLAMVLAANNVDVDDDEMSRLKMQVLRNLIDETLQIQAAAEQELEIQQEEIDLTYTGLAAQNFRNDPQEMDSYLKSIGSSPDSMKRQIHGELAWQRLLRRNVQPFVNVADEEVQEVLQRLKAARGTDEYRLGEIYLAATAENRQAVFDNAKRIIDQLHQGGSFVAYARQFSEASTAAVGGDLGWIRLAQLPGELAAVAREMNPGQLVGPVDIPGGFSILYLIDKRQVLMADARDALLSLMQISIDFPPATKESAARERIAAFAAGVQQIRGCGEVHEMAGRFGADVVANDQVRARNLPPALQDSLLQLQVGQATPPFGSVEEGVRVLMLCGRDDPDVASGPSFDDIMAQIEDERIGKRAQRYLRDLRRDAVIEYN